MSTGEKRTLSARRGMTVLGKIPAVPKPINLPSQRLENHGLDPNLEIVPRGGSGWGTTVRSPPVNNSCWGSSALSSSPPVGSWSTVVKQQGPSTSQAMVREWAKIPAQLSSAESNTRPSLAPASENRFCGATTKFEEQSFSSQFSLTHVDFPTLGSEKNPSLRPQHGAMFSNRPISADGKTLEKSRLLGHEVLGGRPTSAEGRVSDKEKLSYYRGNRPTSTDGNSTDKERHMIYSDISEHTLNSPVDPGRYGHPIDYKGQPPLLCREMLQMDSHVVPLGLGTHSHHPVQYGYYRPPGVLQYTMTDPSRGNMVASRMFPGSYPQLRPLIQLGQPGVCDYHPQQVPSEIYSGPDLAGGIQPSSPHSNYQIYDRETNFEGAHKYGMQQEDWRAAKDLGKPKNGNVDIFPVLGAESSSGRVKGTTPNGNERMGLTTEVGVLVRPGSFRLVGRVVALGQSQADLEASKLLGQSVNLSKESQSNYFQESVQFEEHHAKRNFVKQEQLKEQPETRNAVHIFTSHDSSNSTRVMELSNVKKVSGGLKNEITVPASLLNNSSVNIKESSIGSNSIGDVALNASPSSDITSACIQNDKNQLTSNMVPEGQTQDEQPMVAKQQFVTVSSEGSLGSVHEQGALGSPLRPGLNSSRDYASQHVECLGHDDTSNRNNFAEKEKTSVHANLMPKVLHTERKRVKSESHVEMPRMPREHHDEHLIDKQIDTSKVGIEPTSGKNPKCKKAVSLYPADSNNMKNSSGATVPELSLVFGAVDAAITASLVGASKMDGLATTGSNSVANSTGKKGCKSSISKAEESGNAEWAKTLAITSPASKIGTTGEPINWECESLDANPEEAQVIINDNHSKAVEWKSNPSWHTHNREQSLDELPGMERSSTTEGMKWTPVRACSSNRKNDDSDAATVFGSPLSFSEGLKHSQQHQTARGGQQMLAMNSEQELGIEKLPLQPPTSASKADIKVERRKYKGGSGVYIPRHRRKEQQSSMDGLVETINQTAADEVNKQVTESQAAKHVRETNSQHHRAKQMNLIEKFDVEQEVRLSFNTIVHEDTEGSPVKKKNASLSQQGPVKLQNIVAKPQQGTRKSNRSEETPADEEAKPRVENVFVRKSKNKHENKNHLWRNDRLQPEQQQDSPAGHEVWVQDGKPSHPEKKKNKDEVHRHGQHSVESDEGHMYLRSSQEKKQEPCMLLEPTARYSNEDCPKPAMEHRKKKCHHAPRQQKLQSPHSIEKLVEEECNEQRTMSTSENNVTKTKPHSSETTQRGQRQRPHKSILEIAAEKRVHVTDNPVVSVELKEGIKSEPYDNKEERKQFGAKTNTQHLMSNNPCSGKSSVRDHWEPIQSMLAPVAGVPEARKRKEDMKLHMRKPLSEQQESAAYFHGVGIMPSKGCDFQEPMNTSDRKQHHESWMSKIDSVTDESDRNKQGGLMKNPPKDARGSVNTSYWRKQDVGHRQPIAGIGHGKQQMYVRKSTSMSEGDESVVHSSTVEAQTSKHSEHWLSEGEPAARLPGEGRHRSSVQHESRHGQFYGHRHQVVNRVP